MSFHLFKRSCLAVALALLPVLLPGNPVAAERKEIPILPGLQTIKIIPGQNYLLLPDGETRIVFGRTGRSDSVPDVVFGKQYVLNDIKNINYTAIRDEFEFFNNDYAFHLKNLGCNTEERWTDVLEIWVTDCTLEITSEPDERTYPGVPDFVHTFSMGPSQSRVVHDPDGKLRIYVSYPRLEIINGSSNRLSGKPMVKVDRMTSYSSKTPWDIQVIISGSGFGAEMGGFRFYPDEIWGLGGKELMLGSLQVRVDIVSHSSFQLHVHQSHLGPEKQLALADPTKEEMSSERAARTVRFQHGGSAEDIMLWRKKAEERILRLEGVERIARDVVRLIQGRNYAPLAAHMNGRKKFVLYFRDYDGPHFKAEEWSDILHRDELTSIGVYRRVDGFRIAADEFMSYVTDTLNQDYEISYCVGSLDNRWCEQPDKELAYYDRVGIIYTTDTHRVTLTFYKQPGAGWSLWKIGYF